MRPWAWLVDCHPKLRKLRRGQDGKDVVCGLEALLPEMPPAQLNRLMRAVLRQRAYTMAVTLAMSAGPRVAELVARLIPVRGMDSVEELLRSDGPLLLATFHTGPVYLFVTVVKRALAGRQLYALHQTGGAIFDEIVRLLNALDIESVPNRLMATRTLIKVLKEKKRPVVTFACDYAGGSETVTFFGRRLSAADGVQALHDASGAEVICAVWEQKGWWPTVRFIKPSLRTEIESGATTSLTQALFDELEPVVRAAPHRWASWETVPLRLRPPPANVPLNS